MSFLQISYKKFLVLLAMLISYCSGHLLANETPLPTTLITTNYSQHPAAQLLIQELVTVHKFAPQALTDIFTQAQRQDPILAAMAKPAEKTKPWKEYRPIFVTQMRARQGAAFSKQYQDALKRAEQLYQVPPEIIVAIIGVETRYGHNKGSYKVLNALSTLAFDYPPRADFFRKELIEFLLLCREQKFDPQQLLGSYAGAMGYPQFMPSSYRKFAVDFDGDHEIDLLNNPVDAIGSVANYFKAHGWQPNQPVTVRARITGEQYPQIVNQGLEPVLTLSEIQRAGLTPVDNVVADYKATAIQFDGPHGAEFWLGLPNFYVITRYNHSNMYAMAVYQLSEIIALL